MHEVKVIPGCRRMLCGEGPHWVERDKALIFVDILGGKFHRYFSESGRHQSLTLEDVGPKNFTTLIIPVQNQPDHFIGSVGNKLYTFHWPTSDPDEVTKKPASVVCSVQDDNIRFNDGKCDPKGRLWAGTMAYESAPAVLELEQGKLFRIDSKGETTEFLDKISISNGLAYSTDCDHMYFIDSLAYSVDAFQYDNETGEISGRHEVLDYKAAGLKDDIPDGMAVDSQDNLWVANYLGSKVICIDPVAGKIIRSIDVPIKKPTSVCWGGPDYSTLYVTSASVGLSEEELNSKPDSGKCFAITGLGVKGLPPVEYAYNK